MWFLKSFQKEIKKTFRIKKHVMISVFKRNFHFFIVLYQFWDQKWYSLLRFFQQKIQKQTFTLMAVKLHVLSLQLVFLSINKKLRVSKMYQKICIF